MERPAAQLWGDAHWHPPAGEHAGLDGNAILRHAWRLLREGVADRRSPHHAPTLGTVDANGRPELRAVILRDADFDKRALLCHTRLDCGKVAQVQENSAVSWHSYDAAGKTQLVLSGTATVESSGPLADARWAATGAGGRACYRRSPGTGTPLAAAEDMTEVAHDGRPMFGVLVATIDQVDWLWLHHAGHRRMRFAWEGQRWEGRAIAP